MPLSVDPALFSGPSSSLPSPARITPSGSPGPSPRHTHYRLSIAKTPASSPQVGPAEALPSRPSLSPHPRAPLLSRLQRPRTFAERAVTLALCTVGIYVCFISYAVLQERMSAHSLAAAALCCKLPHTAPVYH